MKKRMRRQIPKYATAHLPKGRECPTIWWAVHKFFGGKGDFCLGRGESQVSHPLYETLVLYAILNVILCT